MRNSILTLVLILAPGLAAGAVQHVHPAAQPATPPEATATSSLTAEQVQQLLDGDGMGLAKPAEVNGYPGPKHILERAQHLGLTETQRERITAIRSRMLVEAQRLGRQIVAAERALDEAFRSRTVTRDDLAVRTTAIAALQAELRAAHLAAHLESVIVLTAEQVKMYYAHGAHATHGK